MVASPGKSWPAISPPRVTRRGLPHRSLPDAVASRDGTTSGRHRCRYYDTRAAPMSLLPGKEQHQRGTDAPDQRPSPKHTPRSGPAERGQSRQFCPSQCNASSCAPLVLSSSNCPTAQAFPLAEAATPVSNSSRLPSLAFGGGYCVQLWPSQCKISPMGLSPCRAFQPTAQTLLTDVAATERRRFRPSGVGFG